jgi:DGQHR domain-containing protein
MLDKEKQPSKKAWLLTATLENWEIAQKNGVFGCHGNNGFLDKIRKGDQYTAFIPKVGFVGYGTITGEYFVSNFKLWEDKMYSHRFQVSTPIISGKVVPPASIVDDLSFVTHKKKWGIFFRAGMREIPLSDFNLISKKINKSAEVLSEIKENVQKGITAGEVGAELHDRVAELFENLGFTILESNYHTAGPDITVLDPEDVNKGKIIIQCKNSKKSESTFKHLDKHLYEYAGRLREGKAQAAILVISGQKLPKKIPGEKGELDIDEILRKHNVALWTDETLEYYEELIDKISHFARYQVLSDLGLRLNFSSDIEAEAIKITQNGYSMYATSLSPDWLLRTVNVVRRIRFADGPKGYQRLLDKSRITNSDRPTSISNYIDSNTNWLFPNAIVLASSRNSNLIQKDGKLKLKSNYGQFWVIDGQHRLFAFANAEARKKDNRLLCVIIDVDSLGDEKDEERELAQIFVTLNGRGKRVPKALLYELYQLLGSDDNPSLEIILRLVGEEFFAGCIRGYSDKEGSINLVSFADAKGTDSIYKYFNSKHQNKEREEIISLVAEYILNSFKKVAKVFELEWNDPTTYFLKTDRGVRGVLSLLDLILKRYGSAEEKILEVMEALKKAGFDFSSETAKGLYLGAGGPEKLSQAFSRHINKFIIDFVPNSSRYSLTSPHLSNYKSIDDEFLREWMGKLEGNVRAQMNFIDKTTIKYLNYLDLSKVNKVRMFFGDARDEKEIREGLEKFRKNGLDIILTQSQKRTLAKGSFFHGRWIGDDKMQVRTEVDLKDNSQKGATFYINVDKWDNPPELDDFERYWAAAETNKEVEFGYNWGSATEQII